jgi:hypothetical protein
MFLPPYIAFILADSLLPYNEGESRNGPLFLPQRLFFRFVLLFLGTLS